MWSSIEKWCMQEKFSWVAPRTFEGSNKKHTILLEWPNVEYRRAGNFRQEKFGKSIAASTVLILNFFILFFFVILLLDLFSHTPKLLPGKDSTLCESCVDAPRRWQATSIERECETLIGEELDCVQWPCLLV